MNNGLFSNNENNKYSRGEIIYSVSRPNNSCLRLDGRTVSLFQRGIDKTFAQSLSSKGLFSWAERVSNFGTTYISSVAFGNSLWVAAGYTGQIRTSTDAITWVTRTSNFGTSNIFSVAYGNNLWVAGGVAGQLRTSTDAITWVTRTSTFGIQGINTLTFANGIFVAGGNNGQLRTSTDAITWVTRTSNFGTSGISSIAYGNGIWVAVGDQGQIRSSTDAVTWVTRTGAGTNSLIQIRYNNKLFATISTNAIFTSTDATTWTRRTLELTDNISCIGVSSNLYFIGTAAGELALSTDAINWVMHAQFPRLIGKVIRLIIFMNSTWLIAGYSDNATDYTIYSAVFNQITPPYITYGWVQS